MAGAATQPEVHPTPYESACHSCPNTHAFMSPIFPVGYGNFGMRCPQQDCNRMRILQFIDGRVVGELPHPPNKALAKAFLARDGTLREIGETLVGAFDLSLVGRINRDAEIRNSAYRGAAVHLRVAAELFVGEILLGLTRDELRKRHYSGMVKELHDGGAPGKFRHGDAGTVSEICKGLWYIADLGDTASHSVLERVAHETPATRLNLEKGFEYFEIASNETIW